MNGPVPLPAFERIDPRPRAAARRWIGGSTAPAILQVSPYTTPLQAYESILGLAELETPEQASFFRRRKAFEPVAAEIFTEKTGIKLAQFNRRLRDPEHAFIRAELDGETAEQHARNLEIKTVHPLAARDWGRDGTGEDVPTYVVAQAMHGLMVSHREVAFVLAMIGFDDARIYQIDRDEETIAAMREREVAFWREHVEVTIPPAAINAGDVLRLHPRDDGTSIEATPDLVELIERGRVLRGEMKDCQTELDGIGDAIRLALGEHAVLSIGGKPAITWKAQNRSAFDQAEFKREYPDLFEAFKRSSSTRVMLWK